jgi:uncharacterized protein YcgI (DUF1989 family)
MTEQHPIENARDPDLRLSKAALMRAAVHARIVAAQTGTCLVIRRGGVVEVVDPRSPSFADHVHEPSAPYADVP